MVGCGVPNRIGKEAYCCLQYGNQECSQLKIEVTST